MFFWHSVVKKSIISHLCLDNTNSTDLSRFVQICPAVLNITSNFHLKKWLQTQFSMKRNSQRLHKGCIFVDLLLVSAYQGIKVIHLLCFTTQGSTVKVQSFSPPANSKCNSSIQDVMMEPGLCEMWAQLSLISPCLVSLSAILSHPFFCHRTLARSWPGSGAASGPSWVILALISSLSPLFLGWSHDPRWPAGLAGRLEGAGGSDYLSD